MLHINKHVIGKRPCLTYVTTCCLQSLILTANLWLSYNFVPRNWTYCSRNPECIVTTIPYISVLITITTWHVSFHPVNDLHVKDECGARSESRFTPSRHCYVTLSPLTTGVVASQYPSSRHVVLVTGYLTPLTSACLNVVKQFYHHEIYLQSISKLKWQFRRYFWQQWLLESPINGATDLHGEYGDTCSASLNTRLLNTGHI